MVLRRENPSAPPVVVVGRVYQGMPPRRIRAKFAHQFADEIIARLSGGLPGIASTQIAFVSKRSGNKEIWAMDYDGANQHQAHAAAHDFAHAALVARRHPHRLHLLSRRAAAIV